MVMLASWKHIALGAGLGLAVGFAPMLAGQPVPAPAPAAAEPVASTPAALPALPTRDCARERDWLLAEENTASILRWLAREAVEHCEAQAAGRGGEPRVTAER